MHVPGHAGYGEFPSSSNIHELYRFNIVCMHYG
jgi:hypothetical protein